MIRVIALTIAMLGGPQAAANPADLYGFGARGSAMGGAHTAATRDSSANYYNPAALADQSALRFDIGYHYARPRLRLNGGDQDVMTSRGLMIGLVMPARVGERYIATLGAGLFLPDEHILLGRTLTAEQPRWALYDNRPQRVFFGTHLALRLGDRVRLGAGLGFLAETSGSYALDGRLGFPNAFDSDLVLDIDVDATPVAYPQAGVFVNLTRWLDVGVAYRGEFVLESIQVVEFDIDIGSSDAIVVEDGSLSLQALSLDLFQPSQIAAGFAAQLTPRLLVAGDVTYARWSRYDNPTPRFTFAFDVGQFNDLIDLPDAAPPLEPLRFHDTLSPRIGVEYLASKQPRAAWKLRGGYAYEPSPAPEQVGESNFVDNDKHAISAGVGVSVSDVTEVLRAPFDIDVYVSTTILPGRSHRKISPINPTGSYVSRGIVIAGGLTTGWRF